MSIASVITLGIGPGSAIKFLVTDGYSPGTFGPAIASVAEFGGDFGGDIGSGIAGVDITFIPPSVGIGRKRRRYATEREASPYLEPTRQRKRVIERANSEVASYRSGQSQVVRGIALMAERAESDPVIIGYQQMLKNGNLVKLAKVNPLGHQALEREYATKVAQAAQLRQRQAQAEAMQI